MDSDLEPVYYQLTQASRLEDVFGSLDVVLPPTQVLKYLEKRYNKLKIITEPTQYQDVTDSEYARDADDDLERFYVIAKQHANDGTYGIKTINTNMTRGVSFTVNNREYYRTNTIRTGDRATLYGGYFKVGGVNGEVVIKLMNDADYNDLARNEIRILNKLHETQVPQWKHLPFLLDRFVVQEKIGLIFRKFSGFDLEHIGNDPLHRDGLDQKHMVWILDRLLSALGYAHRQGIVHGVLTPKHIMIRPNNHNAYIRNWSGAVYNPAITGETTQQTSEVFSAPEVRAGHHIGPWSDIYSLGKVLIWLLGGSPETNDMPRHVEPKIQTFLRTMVHEQYSARPHDAWELYQAENELKDSLWPRKFIELHMSSQPL